MKTPKFVLITLILILISALSFSQNLQPQPIHLNDQDGVFINLELMDLISLKLIDRNTLEQKNLSLTQIIDNLKDQNKEISLNIDLYKSQAVKLKNLNTISEIQKNKALEGLKKQQIITSNLKKKSFKNNVLYFSGGISVGLVFFALLAN